MAQNSFFLFCFLLFTGTHGHQWKQHCSAACTKMEVYNKLIVCDDLTIWFIHKWKRSHICFTRFYHETEINNYLFQVLYHLRPHIITSPNPESDAENEVALFPQKPVSSPVKQAVYIALGAGVASLVFYLITSDRIPKSRIVNNIWLVLDHMKTE